MLCFCLIRAPVSVPSLLRHSCTSKGRDNQREELLILCLMLKITGKMVFKDRGLAGQKADLWEEVGNVFPCWIPDASLLFPVLERKTPCVVAPLCSQ